MTLIKGGLLGGLILFIWSSISWMVLPWHAMTFNHFKNENAVLQAIHTNVDKSGIYLLPSEKFTAQDTNTPKSFLFSSIQLKAPASMNLQLALAFLTQVLAAMLVTWMLTKTRDLSYFGRIGFVLVFAFTASLVIYVPYWNWFYFDTFYILIQLADLLVGWLLAAYAIAAVTKRNIQP